MNVFILQYTNASFSISTDEEYIDEIVIASLDERVIDDYIKKYNITLGISHCYDYDYQYYTKKCVELK